PIIIACGGKGSIGANRQRIDSTPMITKTHQDSPILHIPYKGVGIPRGRNKLAGVRGKRNIVDHIYMAFIAADGEPCASIPKLDAHPRQTGRKESPCCCEGILVIRAKYGVLYPSIHNGQIV